LSDGLNCPAIRAEQRFGFGIIALIVVTNSGRPRQAQPNPIIEDLRKGKVGTVAKALAV